MTAAWLSFALLGFLSGQVRAQIGTDQCACFPSTYTFVLDLALSCGQTSLPNSGVESNECSVLPAEPGAELSSMVPISLSEITVFELGQNLGTTLGTQIPGDSFVSGAPFTYTSSVGSQEGLDMTIASGGFPRGIEVQMRGRNLLSEIIDNRFTIVFSNECGIYPVIEEGDKIGWIKFGSLSEPLDAVCPIAGNPTAAPTLAPTTAPTTVPTNAPVPVPTTTQPTLEPTSSGQSSVSQLPFISLLAMASVAMPFL